MQEVKKRKTRQKKSYKVERNYNWKLEKKYVSQILNTN